MPTYTYDETQATSANVVKFHLRQTGTTAATRDFSDEEIAAVLARASLSTTTANEYWTAAEMLRALILKHGIVGGGIDTRKLSKLQITYGGRNTKLEVLIKLRDDFKRSAALYSRTKPRMARALNISGQR